MIWIDYAILAVVGISVVISLMRGFVREALSLSGWIAAFWIAIAFSGRGAAFLEGYVTVPSWRVAIAFFILLVLVLVACAGSCFAWPACSSRRRACPGRIGRWESCSACCAGS